MRKRLKKIKKRAKRNFDGKENSGNSGKKPATKTKTAVRSVAKEKGGEAIALPHDAGMESVVGDEDVAECSQQ